MQRLAGCSSLHSVRSRIDGAMETRMERHARERVDAGHEAHACAPADCELASADVLDGIRTRRRGAFVGGRVRCNASGVIECEAPFSERAGGKAKRCAPQLVPSDLQRPRSAGFTSASEGWRIGSGCEKQRRAYLATIPETGSPVTGPLDVVASGGPSWPSADPSGAPNPEPFEPASVGPGADPVHAGDIDERDGCRGST